MPQFLLIRNEIPNIAQSLSLSMVGAIVMICHLRL